MNDKRSPIVVVMGHVDHGKTTLLDFIRKTAVAAREAGGITQSIGAYEVMRQSQTDAEVTQKNAEKSPRDSASGLHNSAKSDFVAKGHKITFIDTPGHEAFSKMRSRGAKVADIAILVVAADDSVKPQTKEAIKIIKEAKVPYIVAINKVDKAPENVERVKNDLMQEGVLLEGYGGDVSYVALSAKTGQGVNELLDLILLTVETMPTGRQAGLEGMEYNPAAPARGFILESKLDARQGMMVAAIVKDGTLRTGDTIYAGEAGGRVKILKNFLGERIESALPSSPVLIFGFEKLPKVGEEFRAGQKPKIKNQKENIKGVFEEKQLPETGEVNAIRVVLKGDAAGSVEALAEVVKNLPLPEGVNLEIIDESVGNISDGDVKLAISTMALIVGFRVKANKAAENLAKAQNVTIIQSEIIYELVKAVEETLKGAGKVQVKGDLEILAVFGKKGKNQIVGGRVVAGEIKNNAVVEIRRKEQVVGSGRIINLQQAKKDAQRVEAGKEAGLLMDSRFEIQVGDHLILR